MIEDIRISSKINWAILALFVILMFVMLFYFDRAVAADQDPKAVEVAHKTIDAMGGMEGWMQTGAIRFNFQPEKQGAPPRAVKHLWDHKNGRDHVEGMVDGKPMVAWIDMSKKNGAAWKDGQKLEGADLKKAMDWAYGRWVNDTYWLIMPFKMLDSGVNLKYENQHDGHDVLHLSFGQVGLTPGDQYWVYVNQKTGLVDHWEYLLQGEKEKENWDWTNWNTYGKIKLSDLKSKPDHSVSIHFTPLKVSDSADPAYFTDQLKTLD